jgi:G3E family GTPase
MPATAKLQAVPTNVITGFLGVGKTTAILHLLANKPAGERWAVLVNEFGEIGVDGSFMQGHHPESQGIYVQEVPGGCMCCAAGLPMQVALNQLLSTARPDRLLIEPTGLGHPKEVLQVLSGGPYRTVLCIQRMITIVNACQLGDTRYTDNEIFNQQIEVADVVVANKTDLYQPDDKATLLEYLQKRAHPEVTVVYTTNGKIDRDLLTGTARHLEQTATDTPSHHHHAAAENSVSRLPDCGYIKKVNQGDGYRSAGWRFSEDKIFSRDRLFSLLSGINAERVKAVMNTDTGVFGYDKAADALTEVELFGRGQSCIEMIGETVDDHWESQLLDCLTINSDH